MRNRAYFLKRLADIKCEAEPEVIAPERMKLKKPRRSKHVKRIEQATGVPMVRPKPEAVFDTSELIKFANGGFRIPPQWVIPPGTVLPDGCSIGWGAVIEGMVSVECATVDIESLGKVMFIKRLSGRISILVQGKLTNYANYTRWARTQSDVELEAAHRVGRALSALQRRGRL